MLKGNKVLCPCVFCDHTTGGQCPKNSGMPVARSQSHERLWTLLKLKFWNGWLTSKCCGSSGKKFNSGFQFQFQFQGFEFHQFQFRNWNWNWAAIPIPELNWPQPCSPLLEVHNHHITTREPWVARLLHRPDCFMVSILCTDCFMVPTVSRSQYFGRILI